ncbi:MAG: rane protein-like protein [Candidatus Saccharibacteria bacterium]|nr:rane protein-like protein [Candidatus Saccharibacteria bacterium]
MAKAEQKSKLERWIPYILIIAGIVGVLAAFIITQDKIKLLENPNYKPSCSINPIISCGSVMQSAQSHVFGFANPYIGLVGYPVLITLGVILLSGVRLKRWIWLGLNLGLLFGVAFVHWLFFQSVFHIQALCPYCMGVWVVTITAFWYVTLFNLQQGFLKLPTKLQPVGYFVRRHHLDLLVLWFLIILAVILHHFWYYFGKHLPF